MSKTKDMQVPYLPPELMSLVIRHAATSLGLRQAVKLRLVSHLFDDVVMYAIEHDRLFFVSNPKELEGREEDHDSRVLFVARFLSLRPYAKRDACEVTNFSAMLNRILDVCDVTSTIDRIAGFESLLHLVHLRDTYRVSYRGIFTRLTSAVPIPYDSGLGIHPFDWDTEVLPAAIVLMAPQVYGPLLAFPAASAIEEAPGNWGLSDRLGADSNFFGTPLLAAVVAGAADIVERILGYAPHLFLEAPVEKLRILAAATTGRQDILHILLRHGPRRDWTIDTAIVTCARSGQVEAAHVLLDYAIGDPEEGRMDISWALEVGLRRASASRDPHMIRLFLDYGAKPDDAEGSITEGSPPH